MLILLRAWRGGGLAVIRSALSSEQRKTLRYHLLKASFYVEFTNMYRVKKRDNN